jgi:hypothetical protein
MIIHPSHVEPGETGCQLTWIDNEVIFRIIIGPISPWRLAGRRIAMLQIRLTPLWGSRRSMDFGTEFDYGQSLGDHLPEACTALLRVYKKNLYIMICPSSIFEGITTIN